MTTVRVEGLTEAHAAMAAMGADMATLTEALTRGINAITLRARLGINSRTYQLAGSLVPFATALEARMWTTSIYGGVQEFGWPARHVPAQAFAAGAVKAGWPAVYRELAAYIGRVIAENHAGPDGPA